MIKIIMCTYNGEKYIQEQLDSIAANTVTDWELYISDDGSADRTIQIAESFKQRYRDRVHIQIQHIKQGAAMNFLSMAYEVGSKMTEEDFIMFCDQDDVWYNNKIGLTLAEMNKLTVENGNEVPLLVCSDVAVVNESLELIAESFRKMNHYNTGKLDFPHLMMENKIQGCTLMFNKTLAICLEQLPEKVSMHDGWLGLLAAAMGKIVYIDRPTMQYRQHTGNVMGSVSFWKDISCKIGSLAEQKQIVFKTAGQVEELIRIFGKRIPKTYLEAAHIFVTLPGQTSLKRRVNIIRYHMWKSGMLRNIGLMLLI